MKNRILLLLAVLLSCTVHAAVPPAEKLLPSDTILVVSAPDSAKLWNTFESSPQGKLWNDPAMKAFRDHFMQKLKADLVAPLEKELGIKLADYKGLAQGQLTFAVTQNGWNGQSEEKLGLVLLMDAKDKSEQLKTNLAHLNKLWVSGGKEVRAEKIRDVEFTTLVTTDEEFSKSFAKAFPKLSEGREPAEEGKTNKIELSVGQSGSLLLVGNSKAVLEKVLSRMSGGLVAGLAEEAAYESDHNRFFRDAQAFAWVNPKPLLGAWKAGDTADPMMPNPEKLLGAVGLSGLKSLAFSYSDSPDGGIANLFVGAPEATRQGIFKMLVPEPKDSNPPRFVAANTVKYSRFRLNLQKAFNGFEAMMTEISPAAVGVFKLILDNAGKDQDPNFDLRKELIGNLGDDLITCQKTPRGATAEDVSSPPTLYLISSANPEKLANALKIAMASLGQDTLKERDFLGKKVYSLTPPALTPAAAGRPARTLTFSTAQGYLALSTDVAYVEEFLRSGESETKSLAETAGVTEAAQKVGGMSTGLFAFENQAELARFAVEALRKDTTNAFDAIFGSKAELPGETDNSNPVKQWSDFSLLPSFDAISKYFHYSIYTGNFDANGFTLKFFSPTPPALKK